MNNKEIDKLWPEFVNWMRKRFMAVDMSNSSLKCWYEFLGEIKKEKKNSRCQKK